jgi:hypothetical protein
MAELRNNKNYLDKRWHFYTKDMKRFKEIIKLGKIFNILG